MPRSVPTIVPSSRRTRRFLLAAAIAISLVTAAGAAESKAEIPGSSDKQQALVVCVVPNSLPRTGKQDDGTPQGLDVAVAELVAKELGRTLEFHWCASSSCSWNSLREKRCDLVAGQPQDSGPAKEVAWSIPYCGGRFGLVVHRDTEGIRSPSDLHGKRVGMVAGSLAIAAPGPIQVQVKTREELLDKFVDNKLAAALVDDDFAAWHLHRHPELPLRRVAEYVPRERWNVAFAVRRADVALLKDVDRALTNVMANGQISKAFAVLGVAYRAPFAESDRQPAAINSWKRIQEAGQLVASFDPANLPYSAAQAERPGCDVELAEALARALDLQLKIDWIDTQRKTAIGQLLDGQCDVALGAAIEPGAMDDEEEIADRVVYSRPYYGTGYVLVTRKDGPQAKSLVELQGDKSRRLGAEAGSVADYQLRQRGYLRRLFRTQLSALKSLSDGGIDYAYLWANAGWTVHTSPELQVELVAGYTPEDHWNIAVGVRRGDEELRRHVDEALAKLIADGTVGRTLAGYHVPYFPAFDDAKPDHEPQGPAGGPAPAAGATGVLRHPPSDRGPEPKMQRRQRSKHAYVGLERVQAAGTLVVGLDQNSLPFSAAHPEPAGLDYEIAGLLAEKLGVSLKVYWAYSSHDSYPAKLATKELCDVVLGVMPDDRFGTRVKFTRPYYWLDYRIVVPAGAPRPPEMTPLAVERGLALRGMKERPLHELASLESILQAVANGREAAGYVPGARGQWLAEERWPGKLALLPAGSEPVDRFPICAAVRKSDGSLCAAVDEALDDLAQSGKLASVFQRWHVPYQSPRQPALPAGSATGNRK